MIPVNDTAAPLSDSEVTRLCAEWSALLDGVVAGLAVVSRSTEDEFLTIGGKLQDFYQRGMETSRLATGMVEEVAGDRVTSAMKELGSILDEMERYVLSALTDMERSSQTLREILELMERVAAPLSGFKKVNKVLRMLGISTKIESARLGQSAAGFDSLASDVGNLSIQVNDKALVILRRKDEVARAIAQTLSGVLDSGAEQQDRVLSLLNKTRESLEALSSINARCSSSVAEVSAGSDEVSGKIGDVVMSMQAHDMVRQQIEHVEQALTELREGMAAGLAGADETACICELQIAQLHNAADAFDAAVRTIVSSLREIAGKQASLSLQTRGMAGIADQAGGGFFSAMQEDLAVVSGALQESWKVNRGLASAMGAVAETVGEIATFVGDIETIGEEIKLIALNAQIKSAYTGEEGAALGVLAEAIQRLSVDAIDHTGSVSEVLQSIIGATDRLTGGAADAAGPGDGVGEMVATLDTLLDTLRGVNHALAVSLVRMDEAVNHLAAEIEDATAGITVQQTVSGVLGDALSVLATVVEQARRLAPLSESRIDLTALTGRYTMQSERKVHEALFDAEPDAAAAEAGDDGLGDNVELF